MSRYIGVYVSSRGDKFVEVFIKFIEVIGDKNNAENLLNLNHCSKPF